MPSLTDKAAMFPASLAAGAQRRSEDVGDEEGADDDETYYSMSDPEDDEPVDVPLLGRAALQRTADSLDKVVVVVAMIVVVVVPENC